MEAAGKLGVSNPTCRFSKTVTARCLQSSPEAATLYHCPSCSSIHYQSDNLLNSGRACSNNSRRIIGLGYPGFLMYDRVASGIRQKCVFALAQEDLESRLSEALPWVVLQYTDLDWNGCSVRLTA